MVLPRCADVVDQPPSEIARLAAAERLGGGRADRIGCTEHGQPQQRVGGRGEVDLAKEMDSGDLVPLVPLSEDPDHCRNRVRVGHGLHLGRGLVAELFVLEPRLPALEPGFPEPVGAGLLDRFLLLGCDLLAVHPAAVVLDVPEVFPGRVAVEVELDRLCEVRGRFGLEPVLLAPDAELGVRGGDFRRGMVCRPAILHGGADRHRAVLESLELVTPPVVLGEPGHQEFVGPEPGTDGLRCLPPASVRQ